MPKVWKPLKVVGKMTGRYSAQHNAYDVVAETCNLFGVGPGEVTTLRCYTIGTNYVVDLMVYTDQVVGAEAIVNVPDKS